MPNKLEMQGVTKRFPAVVANDAIDFQVAKGEVHALLGENGAGKSTLMNVLYGLYRPDSGEIVLDGRRVEFHSPRDSITHGIGMVHQSFQLVPTLSVTKNVILGLRSAREPFLDERAAAKEIKKLSTIFGLRLDPRTEVWRLSAGEQQRVEILKALFRRATLLILDEPTSVLTPQESEALFGTLRALAHEGRSVIFISHKLNEVMRVSDRITVLRDGRVVSTHDREHTTPNELAREMVGRDIPPLVRKEPSSEEPGVLRVSQVTALNNRGVQALKQISLAVGGGEILGIAGISGNGQNQLAEVVVGLRRSIAGKVAVGGQDITNCSPRRIVRAGVVCIPEIARDRAVFLEWSLEKNAILRQYWREPFSSHGFLNPRRIRQYAEKLIIEQDVRTSGPSALARQLSGGNLQKFIVARELSHEPRVIVASEPTAGLDVAATQAIRQRLLQERARGAAILLISSDLDEILSLSDRIAVMYEGEIMGIVNPAHADLEELGLMMAGARRNTLGEDHD